MLHDTLRDFVRSKRAVGKARKTIVWYECQLYRWSAWVEATGGDWLSPEALESFIVKRRDDGLKDSSIDGLWKALKVFFVWVRKRRPDLLGDKRPPTEVVDRPVDRTGAHRPRVADYDVVCALIASIRAQTWIDYRDRAIIQLMLSTGLRVGEVVALRVGDVDLLEAFVSVYGGKGDKDRTVPFDADFASAFTAWIYSRPPGWGDWLFIESDIRGRPAGQMTTNAVRKLLERRCGYIGAKKVNPHSIRHLFATKALNDGVPLSAVSTMLGHTSVAFTARVYARWVKRGLREVYDKSWRLRRKALQKAQ